MSLTTELLPAHLRQLVLDAYDLACAQPRSDVADVLRQLVSRHCPDHELMSTEDLEMLVP